MGNDLSVDEDEVDSQRHYNGNHRHHQQPHHRQSQQEREDIFRNSDVWLYVKKELIDRLNATISSENSKLAVLLMFSMGRAGIRDYRAIFGGTPPGKRRLDLQHAEDALISSPEFAHALFGSNHASMSDYFSLAIPESEFDGRVKQLLDEIIVGKPSAGEAPKLRGDIMERLEGLEIPIQMGLDQLSEFHEKHLKNRVLNPETWMWSDTARVALIFMIWEHWRERISKEFGKRLSRKVVFSLALERLGSGSVPKNRTPDDLEKSVFNTHRLLRTTILTAMVEAV